LVGVLVVMWAASQRLLGIAWVTVASNFLGALVLSVYLARRAGWKFPFSKTFLRESFLYGLRGHARVLLMQITVRFDQFALGALLEPKYLGWYSVSVGLAEGLQMLPDSVGMILFPRVASEPGAAGALAARACRCTLLVTLAAAAALALCGKPFVWLLYSKQFLPAVTPLQVLCAAIVFQTASRVLRNYLYGIGRPQLSLWSTGAAAIATVALIFPLVKAYGMVGAALTSLLAQALGAAVDVYLAKRLSGLPAAQFIFPQRSDLRLAARKL
jgi:O-antigen/teichoic acid export membrane protein